MDNIFIERLWRLLKYEAIYLHEIADGLTARRLIRDWVAFLQRRETARGLGERTSAEAYRDGPPVDMMDKPLRALPTIPGAGPACRPLPGHLPEAVVEGVIEARVEAGGRARHRHALRP